MRSINPFHAPAGPGDASGSRLVGLCDAETVENVSCVLAVLADYVGDRPEESTLTPPVRAGVALMIDMVVDALATLDASKRPVPPDLRPRAAAVST